ncbi:MAG: hypothetical protein ACC614_02250, partial [Methanobacterium formicicum]|uniref:hypothetical protein n=1 Tax=Methanobacterium formicicum TaxID=2162 RepID=UPI0035312408
KGLIIVITYKIRLILYLAIVLIVKMKYSTVYALILIVSGNISFAIEYINPFFNLPGSSLSEHNPNY